MFPINKLLVINKAHMKKMYLLFLMALFITNNLFIGSIHFYLQQLIQLLPAKFFADDPFFFIQQK